MSHLEAQFMHHVTAAKLPAPVRELRLHKSRRFRFDFAWPEHRLAVEIEGGAPELGHHHTSRKGYLSDCRKYNLAVTMGWRVLRFTAKQVRSGEALKWTEFILSGKTIPYADGRHTGPEGTAREGAAEIRAPDRRRSRAGGKEDPRRSSREGGRQSEQVGQARDLRAQLAHAERVSRVGEAGAVADQGAHEATRVDGGHQSAGDRQL